MLQRLAGRAGPVGSLTLGGLAWALAAALTLLTSGHDAVIVSFVTVGLIMFALGLLLPRMQGDTKLDKDGFSTNLAPAAVAAVAHADYPAAPHVAEQGAKQGPPLVAKAPTLTAALTDLPSTWSQTWSGRKLRLRSARGAFEIIVDQAACDSPAPRWFLSIAETD